MMNHYESDYLPVLCDELPLLDEEFDEVELLCSNETIEMYDCSVE